MKGFGVVSLLMRSNNLVRLSLTCKQCALARNRLLQEQAHVGSFTYSKILSVHYSTSKKCKAATNTSQGLWNKIKFDFGFISGLKYNKSVLNVSAFRMLICCTEMIDYQQFFSEFGMPDTFNSWFLVTDLHVWLCMVRLGSLGKEGRLLRNNLVKALWEDVETRSKKLGRAATLSARQDGIKQLANIFYASLFGYDEGLLGNDKDLAGAVWRNFLEMNPNVQPAHLELLVSYIRKQVAHLDNQEESTILGRGFVTFLPLKGEELDEEMTKRQALTVDRIRTKV